MKTWFINLDFQVYQPQGRAVSVKEAKYSSRLDQLLVDPIFLGAVFRIAPAVTCYLQSLPFLVYGGVRPGVPQESWDDIGKFGILCLEVSRFFSFHYVVTRLNLCFKNHTVQKWSCDEHALLYYCISRNVCNSLHGVSPSLSAYKVSISVMCQFLQRFRIQNNVDALNFTSSENW
jgi:hypothetical protein